MKWLAFLFILLAVYEEQQAIRWKNNYDTVHAEFHRLEEKCKP
jgi:hypothetical protein